jgi:hypothetical protein
MRVVTITYTAHTAAERLDLARTPDIVERALTG